MDGDLQSMNPLLYLRVENAPLDPLDLLNVHLVNAEGGKDLCDGVVANGDVYLAQLLAVPGPGPDHAAYDLREVDDDVGPKDMGGEVVGREESLASFFSAVIAATGVLEIGALGVGFGSGGGGGDVVVGEGEAAEGGGYGEDTTKEEMVEEKNSEGKKKERKKKNKGIFI